MRKDDQMLNAMYAKVHQEVIEEAGLGSRIGARLSGAYGAAKQAVGDVTTAISGKKPAPDAGWRGKYTAGKQENIIGTLTDDIINDLKKLGLISSPQDVNKNELEGILNNYLNGINANTKTPTDVSREPSTSAIAPAPSARPEPHETGSLVGNKLKDMLNSGEYEFKDGVYVPKDSAPAKSAPVMGTSTTSSPVTPKTEPVESEAGEVLTDEERAKRQEYIDSAKATITGKQGKPEAAPEAPKADAGEIKKNIAKNRTATGASGFKDSTAAKSSEPEAPIPPESTFVTKKGVKFIYNSDGSNAWERVLKSGNTEELSHPEDQKKLNDLWRKQKSTSAPAKPEPKRSDDLMDESFKSFFWN